MNPTPKQFSLNRAASKKQIPISFSKLFWPLFAASSIGLGFAPAAYPQVTPEFLWAQNKLGAEGWSVALDDCTSVYVTGSLTEQRVPFGGTVLTNRGFLDGFVAKHDGAGNLLWVQQFGGDNYDYGESIAVDGTGNALVTGLFSGTASFGPTNLANTGSYDIFLAKYGGDGNLLWARKAGGSMNDEGRGVALDSGGNAFITGHFAGTATFGVASVTTTGFGDVFVAKYDQTGQVIWVRKTSGTNFTFNQGRAIAVDTFGNAYVTGRFEATTTFGANTLTTTGTNGWQDIFLAKYNSNGDVVWVRKAGGITQYDESNAIAIDSGEMLTSQADSRAPLSLAPQM